MGSGEGDALASLSCWGLALDVPSVEGTSGVLWWLAAASFSSSARCCAALGPAWISERRLRLYLRSVALRCLVSALVAWASWSSTRVEHGLGAGVLRFVLYRFSASFPYKLAIHFFYTSKAARATHVS